MLVSGKEIDKWINIAFKMAMYLYETEIAAIMKYPRACITCCQEIHIFMHKNVHGTLYLSLQYIKNYLKTMQN
jgi:hypothetical protein